MARISGLFGQQYGAGIEATKSGKNVGVDFAIPTGTPVPVPEGTWKVIDTKTGVKGGNRTDYKSAPYGNSVMVQNTATGEKLRLSHLSSVDVRNGDILRSGTIVGNSGATGNVTGAHLDVEYYNANGKLADVLKTGYGQYYAGKNPIAKESMARVGDVSKKAISDLKNFLQKALTTDTLSEKEFEDYINNNL